MAEFQCQECGKTYVPKVGNQKACSVRCIEARDRRKRVARDEAKRKGVVAEVVTCALVGCEKTFERDNTARMAKKRFCSVQCGKNDHKRRSRGVVIPSAPKKPRIKSVAIGGPLMGCDHCRAYPSVSGLHHPAWCRNHHEAVAV